MSWFIASLLSFPTAVFTVLLAISTIYWLLVIVGAADIDFIQGDGIGEGAVEGLLAGGKGAGEAAAHGVAEGASEALVATKAVSSGGVAEAAGLWGSLGFNRAPITVVVSCFSLFGWASSLLLQSLGVAFFLTLVGKLLILLISGIISLPLSALAVRPLGRLFVTHEARNKRDLIGSVAVVSTGRVDGKFGQAAIEDGGAGLILQVRCDVGDPKIGRGERVLLVEFDDERQAYVVEPMQKLLE